MATLAEDMATFFTGLSLIEGLGLDCFSDIVPEEPDHLVVLYEYPSDPYLPYLQEVHRAIQVIVRDKSPHVAKALALKLFKALYTENQRVDFTAERFGLVYLRQAPFKLKTVENDRVLYCFNIGITTTID